MSPLHAILFALTLAGALGAGLIAGVFFAFSSFVMRALGRLPAPHGIAAMQSINIVVINPVFLGVFMGTALASAACVVVSLLRWSSPDAIPLLTGGVLYILGTFLVTLRLNVPLNNALERLTPDDPDAASHWTRYLRRWTAWNHVRTLAALLAAAAFIVALSR